MVRTLLSTAFPEFWVSDVTHRCWPDRWVAARKDVTASGLHALIAELDTLQSALLLIQALAGGQIPYGPPV